MSTSEARDRTSASASASSALRGLPASLRTPSFTASTNPASPVRYSPGISSHGASEDALVIEIGSKFLRAGFSNEPHPRCVLAWNKGMFKRSGDKVTLDEVVKRRGTELWKLELRGLSLGLVEDLLERGAREAYHKYLLIDSKTKKLILPVPPLFPTRLLTSVVATLFSHFQPPSITLLPSPVLATVAAGLRSALVVDIGWYETIVTPVYDLRAIHGRGIGVYGRSKRGVKCLRKQWVRLLTPHYRKAMGLPPIAASSGDASDPSSKDLDSDEDDKVSKDRPNLNDVAEAMERLGWCRPLSAPLPAEHTYRLTKIPLPSSSTSITLPFSDLSTPAERAFFAPTTEEDPQSPLSRPFSPGSGNDEQRRGSVTGRRESTIPSSASEGHPDDDDFPLPRLLYNVLLRCTVDVRAACLKRIIFVGGGARIPGLQTRTIEELQILVNSLKWSTSPGARLVTKKKTAVRTTGPTSPRELHSHQELPEEEGDYDWHDHVRDNIQSNGNGQPARESEDTTETLGQARAVKSLGAWAGGSLVGGLKIIGKVELEREKFLTAVARGETGFPMGAF